jgi:hypothetical protein
MLNPFTALFINYKQYTHVNRRIYFEDALYGCCNDDGDFIFYLESLPSDKHWNFWCLRSSGVLRSVIKHPLTEHCPRRRKISAESLHYLIMKFAPKIMLQFKGLVQVKAGVEWRAVVVAQVLNVI